MLLDWFTIFAQALNFFVLMALLKFFLYRPIVQAMNERKQRVAEEMSDVRKARVEADVLSADLHAKHEELEKRTSEVMAKVHAEAEAWRKQAMESAHVEINTLREEWLAALGREKESIAINLKKKLMHEVTATAARMIHDLADNELEQQVISGFMRKIETEAQGIDCKGSEILVRTGFSHTGTHLQKLNTLLDELFPTCKERIFTQDNKLGLGIELIAGDRKWEWNLASYMKDLEQNILDEINV